MRNPVTHPLFSPEEFDVLLTAYKNNLVETAHWKSRAERAEGFVASVRLSLELMTDALDSSQ